MRATDPQSESPAGPSAGKTAATPAFTVAGSMVIKVSAADAYAAVSDVTRMGEWSPECRGARILGKHGPGPRGPARVGTRFLGLNRASWLPWATLCTVTAAAPGVVFAFRAAFLGVPLSQWTYRFTHVDGGCEVTEEWLDLRAGLPGIVLTAVTPVVTGVVRRTDRNHSTIRTTLAALRDVLESGRQ